MTTHPIRIVQTTKEAKRDYKKNGVRISEREQKRLERELEVENRAARIRHAEERKRIAKKKRLEKEKKEQEARQQIGVGLATQLAGYSHTQRQLKGGMEAFLGLGVKKKDEQHKEEEQAVQAKLAAIIEDIENEPWDDDDVLDADAMPQTTGDNQPGDTWSDDEFDDNILLEAHDQFMSDAAESTPDPLVVSEPLSRPVSAPQLPKSCTPKEDVEFIRLHGPINKALEGILESLPDPLIELLSQDMSLNQPTWNPAPSLLHMLNPVGLPPHRLRIKIGCIVTLLRDLNTSSQLSRSQHLRILRVENERLECIVLDGQLEGTKTFLTRVPFSSRYRNQHQFPFSRMQFPIRVAPDFTPPESCKASTKPRSQTTLTTERLASTFKKPIVPSARPKPATNPNPSFKRPALPASKAVPSTPSKPAALSPLGLLDCWDDFLDSGTQIARELSSNSMILPQGTTSGSSGCDLNLRDLMPENLPTATVIPQSPDKTLGERPEVVPENLSKTLMPPPTRTLIQPRPDQKRKLPSQSIPPPPAKRPAAEHVRPLSNISAPPPAPSLNSFMEFGMSTQDMASFIDEDESSIFGTPPIAA